MLPATLVSVTLDAEVGGVWETASWVLGADGRVSHVLGRQSCGRQVLLLLHLQQPVWPGPPFLWLLEMSVSAPLTSMKLNAISSSKTS